jgi:hypothetical protein
VTAEALKDKGGKTWTGKRFSVNDTRNTNSVNEQSPISKLTSETESTLFRNVKIRLIQRYGTLRNAARGLDCSVNGLRGAALGKCPGILERMRATGLFSTAADGIQDEETNYEQTR